MVRTRTLLPIAALLVVTMCAADAVGAADARVGGSAEVYGFAAPIASTSGALDVFVVHGDLQASSVTDVSLFPYTLADETLSLSLVRDWLSVTVSRGWSVLPLGITSASIVARARPAPWAAQLEAYVANFAVEGEARLKGDRLTSTPLRAELWVQGTADVGRAVGALDRVSLGVTLEGTLSAPNGELWPTPALTAAASFDGFTLTNVASLSFAEGAHFSEETMRLAYASADLRLSGEAWCTFSEGASGPTLGLRVRWAFGDEPILSLSTRDECAGGVCRSSSTR